MKKLILALLILFSFAFAANAQYKKDGTPDMRYKANKSIYGGSNYSNSSSVYNTGTSSDIRYQSGYTRSDGTPVQSHYKTNNNDTNWDNFSTKNNYNHTNGTIGTRAKDYSTDALNYGSGKTIYSDSKGGQYYINSNGNKTYVPKR